MLRRPVLAALLAVFLVLPSITLAVPPAPPASRLPPPAFFSPPRLLDTSTRSLTLGQLELTPCEENLRLWCGSLPEPLDRDDPGSPMIDIGFAWRPAHGVSRGTLVVQEGGPGYPTVGSFTLWRGMYGPLLMDHDLLMVDERGTGRSAAIDCSKLQKLDASQSGPTFQKAIADCGKQLNETFQRHDGQFVHASDLFNTPDGVDDLAAVIAALGVGPVDLYGDSYGSFFAQAFAARHPELLRSLVLDATWQLVDADPWYPEIMRNLRFAFDAVCQRSLACNTAAPGSAAARLAQLADALRDEPISGEVAHFDKDPETITVAATDLAGLAWTAGTSARIYRDLDAAGRAALAGDPHPLLRLAAEEGLNGTLGGGLPVESYSVGMAVALPCTDYPQVYDMTAPQKQRSRQFEAAADALPADSFWPFAKEDWLQSPIQDLEQCLAWPAPTHVRELAPNGLPLVPPTLPVLMLTGDLDTFTALGGAELAQRQPGPSARLLVFPSNTHVVAQGDVIGCGSAIVREFVTDPSRLDVLDVDCLSPDRFPEIRATGVFPLRLDDQPLPEPAPANEASPEDQRLAALAVSTAGDAIAYAPGKGDDGVGLRGGTITSSDTSKPSVLTLSDVRYAEDVAVSGTVTIPHDPAEPIVADLTATADGDATVTITATWFPLESAAMATIDGVSGTDRETGAPLHVIMPAP